MEPPLCLPITNIVIPNLIGNLVKISVLPNAQTNPLDSRFRGNDRKCNSTYDVLVIIYGEGFPDRLCKKCGVKFRMD